jgi:hypothetical protein
MHQVPRPSGGEAHRPSCARSGVCCCCDLFS